MYIFDIYKLHGKGTRYARLVELSPGASSTAIKNSCL